MNHFPVYNPFTSSGLGIASISSFIFYLSPFPFGDENSYREIYLGYSLRV